MGILKLLDVKNHNLCYNFKRSNLIDIILSYKQKKTLEELHFFGEEI